MKLRWPKKIKYGVVIGGIMLTVISIGLIAYEGKTPHQQVSEKTLCTYENKQEMNYEVNVNSTKLYDQKVVPAGQYYVSDYAESVLFNYVNTYIASVEAEIQGQYKITAEFRGYTQEQGEEGEKKMTVWSKNEVLKNTTLFTQTADKHQINEKIKVNLTQYNSFIKKLQEEENLSMPTEVILKIEGKETVKLPKEEVEMPILATAVIPITSDYFKIDQQVSQAVEGKQTEEVITPLPINHKLMIAEGVVGFLSLIGCILVGIFVTDIEDKEKMARKIKGIYIEYGSKMVHVDTINKQGFKNIYKLNKLEDLIKLAEELEKPILVEQGQSSTQPNFYVIEQQDLYSYYLEDISVQDIDDLEEWRTIGTSIDTVKGKGKGKAANKIETNKMAEILEED